MVKNQVSHLLLRQHVILLRRDALRRGQYDGWVSWGEEGQALSAPSGITQQSRIGQLQRLSFVVEQKPLELRLLISITSVADSAWFGGAAGSVDGLEFGKVMPEELSLVDVAATLA